MDEKAADPECLGVFYKFKSLFLMFLMRLKPGTGRFIAYRKIWIWKTCSRMVCARIMVQNEFEINSVWVQKMQARTVPKAQTSKLRRDPSDSYFRAFWKINGIDQCFFLRRTKIIFLNTILIIKPYFFWKKCARRARHFLGRFFSFSKNEKINTGTAHKIP